MAVLLRFQLYFCSVTILKKHSAYFYIIYVYVCIPYIYNIYYYIIVTLYIIYIIKPVIPRDRRRNKHFLPILKKIISNLDISMSTGRHKKRNICVTILKNNITQKE